MTIDLAPVFDLARERQRIKQRRDAGEPRPWTDDPLLRKYHVCNVLRDDDAVSRCIMQELIPANPNPWVTALVGRLVNQEHALRNLFQGGQGLRSDWRQVLPSLTVNTSAYKINTPLGLNNREGLVQMIQAALERWWPTEITRLQEAFDVFCEHLGKFVAYQAALDLKGSVLPLHPDDEDSWTYIGIGAVRGALLVHGFDPEAWTRQQAFVRPKDGTRPEVLPGHGRVYKAVAEWIGPVDPSAWTHDVACLVLDGSRDPALWPRGWPAWHLGDAEHMLCEYDKVHRWRTIGPSGARVFRFEDQASLF